MTPNEITKYKYNEHTRSLSPNNSAKYFATLKTNLKGFETYNKTLPRRDESPGPLNANELAELRS